MRAGRPSDVPFIESSWRNSASHSSEPAARKPGFHGAVNARAREIAARADTRVRVACVPGDEDAILGWAVVEPALVHYVYVRRDARRQGIARALLADLIDPGTTPIVAYTSLPLYRGLKLPPHWSYNENL
jgi:GNAT superfamily N-acetyltransferase